MGEYEEFAEALMDQLSVEINEEKEISELSKKISEDSSFTVKFEDIEKSCQQIFDSLKEKISQYVGIPVSNDLKITYPDLHDFKMLKGKKVFADDAGRIFTDKLFDAVANENLEKISNLIKEDTAKFLVYSTYAKGYISKISTTYGDYLDSKIYLNKFVLSSYPQIILYKQGPPYESRAESVRSGYTGALKMTMLEETVHSLQENLHRVNKEAVIKVNTLNEELARIILALDDQTSSKLSEYLQLPSVPDEFPVARRANLFFMLNPDNFIVNVLGPDVMTFTKVEVDPKISEMVPELLDIYQRWLGPIQTHHAAFTTMEGMAEFAVQDILRDDDDFQNYLTTFMGTDYSSYRVRKSMGKDFTSSVFEKHGKQAFKMLIENHPSTRELKDPSSYLKRI
ncbi:hypothetical protein C6988_01780 [Nitrosopumilus sp. b1]|uniref:hypothetical protein n=1 Tax=Nitrosopumilus sp. b1 TaxID=2109907 RepID=UPI0015F69A88|nr:hypothetical protein [Nitrosopumilus sp. b1]KAF6243769.1 hypothetical protein C6988_01780 [Nitrosopumilus sp. b1]